MGSAAGDDDHAYDVPDAYQNLDETADPAPVQRHNPRVHEEISPSGVDSSLSTRGTWQTALGENEGNQQNAPHISDSNDEDNVPDSYANLDELADASPAQNPGEDAVYTRSTLEGERRGEREYEKEERESESRAGSGKDTKDAKPPGKHAASHLATRLYTISYLILFSFLGTLARLGLQAITFYPGAPVAFSVLWANFSGSLFMGFLSEDRMLFRHEWGTPKYDQLLKKARQNGDEENVQVSNHKIDLAAAKKEHAATKKTIPLYIGLATGFCGSFTSFSSFIRDVYLALSNNLPTPLSHPADYQIATSTTSTVHRNGGYSFMALIAVILVTVSVCLAALQLGAHIAILLEPLTPSLPFRLTRRILDPLALFLAWGCWLGAILLAIFPPDRHSGGTEIWRGRAVFALVFAPLGCLGRFYASLYLNSKIPSFPLGTFVVNVFGTAVLGMAWDLQHVPLGGVVGCQVLQGIEDGFCGCLTTVSTWVSELTALRRSHAYKYGAASVGVALAVLVVIMGGLRWTDGFAGNQCTH